MATIQAKAKPAVEAVAYDGSNANEVLDLVGRVADLHVWTPLDSQLTAFVRTDPPHLGLNVQNNDGAIVARVEEGNVLVFDPFAETPLFVLTPEQFASLYEEN